MEKKQLTYVVLVVIMVAGALGMRHYFSKEQMIRRHLFEAVESFKNEKILGFMSKISRSYTDDWAGSYEILGGQAQSLMDAYDGLTVDMDITAVEVGDDEARIVLAFVVGGRNEIGRGNIFGSEIEPCRATLRWVKEEPGWRLVETEELDIPEYRDQLDDRRTR
jgi:hypothetical protein